MTKGTDMPAAPESSSPYTSIPTTVVGAIALVKIEY